MTIMMTMTMLISIWINMIVIPCEKKQQQKNVRADRKPCVWKYFVLKKKSLNSSNSKKKKKDKKKSTFWSIVLCFTITFLKRK